ncbi:MAG TPA: serine/threonine-protein kinase [Solirubrobacteraceae bacterium]
MDHRNTLVAPARAGREPVLGRYRLHQRLGAGGFGIVWRAHDELLHREVALKQISLPTEEDRDRATREALATARLSHPAIVALYEACSDEQDFYLISELVHGETLATLIADDALGDEEVLEVGVVLCDALAHAHARGVIHRDIKPQNVLLPDPTPEPGAPAPVIAKLTDFGGAQLVGEEGLTRSGDVLGTLAYMAPEQSDGRDAGPESDLYSLALVLYEALSGVNPVRGATPAATVRRIGQPLAPLERHRRDLPRALTRTLDAALLPDPRERGTLAELREALQEELDGDSPARHRAPQPHRASHPSSSSARPDTSATTRRPADSEAAQLHEEPDTSGWLTAERFVWLLGVFAACAWQLAAGRSGVAVLIPCAVLPLLPIVRRPGPTWLAAVIAPLLGVIGLAGAFPAVAGQRARWRERALLGALGYWWLALAESPLGESGHPLWIGAPTGVGGVAGYAWRGSLSVAVEHVLLPTVTVGLLFGAALWALAAVLLPWLVRGRDVKRDALAAIGWAVALAGATPLLLAAADGRSPVAGASHATPHGLLLGTACGAAFAICARALRGGVPRAPDARAEEAVDPIT